MVLKLSFSVAEITFLTAGQCFDHMTKSHKKLPAVTNVVSTTENVTFIMVFHARVKTMTQLKHRLRFPQENISDPTLTSIVGV